MTRRTRRALGVVSGLLAAIAVSAVAAISVGAKSAGKADSGTVYFAPTHTLGSISVYAGDTTDKLLGPGAAVYRLRVLATTKPGTARITVKKVTGFFATGSLTGTASGTVTILDTKGNAKVTDGVLKFTKGTGAEVGHTTKGKFSGSGNINTGQYKIAYTSTYH